MLGADDRTVAAVTALDRGKNDGNEQHVRQRDECSE
jgi:hypothetical protein